MNEYYPDYLMHYGVKGMKWGVRRYRNKESDNKQTGLSSRFKISKEFVDNLRDGYETNTYGEYETSAMTKRGDSNVKVSVISKKGSESRDTRRAVNYLKKFNDDKLLDRYANTATMWSDLSISDIKTGTKLGWLEIDTTKDTFTAYYDSVADTTHGYNVVTRIKDGQIVYEF